jgi:hypothetical protein
METMYNFGVVIGRLAGKQVLEKLGETRKYGMAV